MFGQPKESWRRRQSEAGRRRLTEKLIVSRRYPFGWALGDGRVLLWAGRAVNVEHGRLGAY